MHKRNVIAMLCTAAVAVGIVLSLGLGGAPEPGSTLLEFASVESGEQDGASDEAVYFETEAPSDSASTESTGGSSGGDSEYVPGVVLVRIDEGYSIDQVNEQLARLDYIATPSISEDDLVYGYVELELAEGIGVDEASTMLADVNFASTSQPNYVYYLQDAIGQDGDYSTDALGAGSIDLTAQSTILDDPYADMQWALDAVNAYEAWDYYRGETAEDRGNPVTVAVIDSGMNVSHEDFESSRIVGAQSFLDDSPTADVTDNNGHGTHVAGIVAATANNGKGVAGVSYNARIMPVQVVDSNGDTSTTKVAAALEYVVDNADAYNVRVVNISIGTLKDQTAITDQALLDAIARAHNKGLLLVYASGNGGSSGAYRSIPCDFDEAEGAIGVISVGRSGSSYARSGFSNYNMSGQTTKDISAPGGTILSTIIPNSVTSVTYLPDTNYQYGKSSGTSMAAPYVSGIAALVFAANPDATAEDVRNILCDTAQDLGTTGWDEAYGAGLVDAEAALKATVPDAAPILTGESLVDPFGVPIMLSVSNGGMRTWSWSSSDDTVATVVDGQVTGRSAGVATIYATSDDIVLSHDVTVAGAPLSAATVEFGTNTYNGAEQRPQPTVRIGSTTLTYGVDYTVSYPDDCTNAGKKTVTITALDSGIVEGSTSASYTISKRKLTLTAKSSTKVYDGTALSAADVGYSAEGLVKASDLSSVTLSGSITNVGSTTSQVSSYTLASGMAQNYNVTKVSGMLKVTTAPLSSCSVSLSQTSYKYDGTAKTPTVTVKDNKGNVLTLDADYTVTYSNNTNAGTASVVVKGKGNYTGTKTLTFTIEAMAPAPTCVGATQVPVGATATYALSNSGSISIKSGAAYATLSGKTLTGKAAGTVVLSVKDSKGYERSTFSVKVYALSGSYNIQSAIDSSMVLDISGGSLYNGGNLQLYKSNNTAAQVFSFALQNDGYYRITCTRCGKVIDVAGGKTANGTNVQQYAWNSSNAQRWAISVDASNCLTFTCKGSPGKVIDVAGGKPANGTNVQQYASNGTNAQKWTLRTTSYTSGPIPDGVYRVTSSINTGYALDVSGASSASGANVQIYSSNGTNAQKWKIVHQGSGYYQITCEASGKALDVSGASKSNCANVQQYVWNGTNAQLWRIEANRDGTYTFVCKASTKALDVSGGVASNGRNVWQYESNSTNAQKWRLYQY